MPNNETFHVKPSLREKFEIFVKQAEIYHRTLDLMSDVALSELEHHIADALAYVEEIEATFPDGPILDVGSGVGLPGIILAAAMPERTVVLAERRKKRATFLDIVKSKLNLENVMIHRGDVRELNGRVGVISSQAVGPFKDIYCLTRHLHKPTVLMISRKSDNWQQELKALSSVTTVETGEIQIRPLKTNGTLVAVRVPGGQDCPSSVS